MAKKRKKQADANVDEHGQQDVDSQLDEIFEASWDEVEAKTFEEVPAICCTIFVRTKKSDIIKFPVYGKI